MRQFLSLFANTVIHVSKSKPTSTIRFLTTHQQVYKQKQQNIMQAFLAESSLHFANVNQFQHSTLNANLQHLLNQHYQLKPYVSEKLKTISMKETLHVSNLDKTYQAHIEENYNLLGFHGTSFLSLPNIIPYPHDIKMMNTFHNTFHKKDGPLWFFYGDNISMAMHYSHLNSVQTESLDEKSDSHFYPNRVVVAGFASQKIIETLNRNNESDEFKKIIATETIAFGKSGTSHEHVKIGKEIRVPTFYHNQILNLPIFTIKGKKRLFVTEEENISLRKA